MSQKHTRLCVVWGAKEIHGVVVIFGASAGLVSRYISRLPHSNFQVDLVGIPKTSPGDAGASKLPVLGEVGDRMCAHPLG